MRAIIIVIFTELPKQKNWHNKALTAVFGASWFDELAGWTGDSGVKQPPVIWIDMQLASDSLLCHCACQAGSREETGEKKYCSAAVQSAYQCPRP